MKKEFTSKGIITTYILIFGSVFIILLGGSLRFILLQLRQANQEISWNKALEVAEAGINYYQWCLNNDIADSCLLTKEYEDPSGNIIGTFSLEVESTINCGIKSSNLITSTGWAKDFPEIKRVVRITYAKTSVAKYSYLLNDNVWAGADREIRGLYHANGGIRMDGENQSSVTSAQEEWACTDSFGCNPCPTSATPPCRIEGLNCICPGVFTTTGNSQPDLFVSPTSLFDFDGITINLAEIKGLTVPNPQQYYWPPSVDINAGAKGYHLKLKNDGTFEVWIITELEDTYAYNIEEDWHYDSFTIKNEYLYGAPIAINPNCSLLFVEDNLWIEGEVKGKLTVASANLISPTEETSIVLPGNINYTAYDGSNGLTLIGEKNILISPDSPEVMELRGIFVAQQGRFGRNNYPDNIREKLEIYGAIISNGRVGTRWSSAGHIVSGYLKRETYSDSSLLYSPPPFTPNTSSELRLVDWEEVE